MRTLVCSLIVWTAACDTVSAPVDDGENRSGTRLKARWIESADGVRMFRSWFDSDRGTTCWVARASDGQRRCLPLEGVAYFYNNYADSACATRIANVWRGDCPPATIAHVQSGFSGCENSVAVHQLGDAFTPTILYAKDFTTGECVPSGPPAPESQWRALGAEIPPASFVALTPDTGDARSRLRHMFYLGEDGSRVARSRRWDSDREEECDLYDIGNDTVACVPGATSEIGYYHADAQCNEALAAVDTSCADQAAYGLRWVPSSDVCVASQLEVWELGAALVDPTLYGDNGGTCDLVTDTEPWYDYRPLATPVPLGDLAQASFFETTIGRLRTRVLESDDGYRLPHDYSLFDVELGIGCYDSAAVDGSTRCMPYSYGVTALFSDANCTTPLRLIEQWVGGECPSEPPLFASEPVDPVTCGYRQRIFRAGAATTFPAQAWSGDPMFCTPYPASPDYAYFQVGAELMPDEMVELTLVTDE